MPPKTQLYSRDDESFFDVSQVSGKYKKFSDVELEKSIKTAIEDADAKSMRKMLDIPDSADSKALRKAHKKAGKKLFELFQKYCVDPATANAEFGGKPYESVVKEVHKNQMVTRARMNAGWRYQLLAKDLAAKSDSRFKSVAGGGKHADISLIVMLHGGKEAQLYISVKNRYSTISGSKWPATIASLEHEAVHDANRIAKVPYLCVFALAMERSGHLRRSLGNSSNTELWKSDFFWSFLTGLSYKDIMMSVGRVLEKQTSVSGDEMAKTLPPEVLQEFEVRCRKQNLLTEDGLFESGNLVEFFL
jgi:hypothetical protein